MSEGSLEAPEADAAEQQATAGPADPGEEPDETPDVPLEADSADTAEQAREVGPDDREDYR